MGLDHRLVQMRRSHKLKVCDWMFNYLILPNFQFGTPFWIPLFLMLVVQTMINALLPIPKKALL